MTTLTLSLVSHTNVGKTTLARTLLGRDIGEVRDAPHVTEFADEHLLIESPEGHRLMLWDTPGFGDSVRLARRMRQSANPLGWLLGQVWDRWRDRALWASQQALRHVRDGSDVLLYLVNASEPEAGYLTSELQLLAWTGRPVIVLLNQLGVPRAAAEEADEVARWRERLAPWSPVRAVLPLDAFARCWAHERVLLDAVREVVAGDAQQAMDALRAAWLARREVQFGHAMAALAQSLARVAAAREPVAEPAGLGERLRQWGERLVRPGSEDPTTVATQKLTAALDAEVRAGTQQLLALHGLDGTAGSEILARIGAQIEPHRRLPEGRAAVLGGAVTGALAGLKADIATGGLTLGGGLLAGGVIGALGAAGLARGINLMRGTGHSWVAWNAATLHALVETALLRYLAVAHYGRGRGGWAEAELPAHWLGVVAAALAPHREALEALWKGRGRRGPGAGPAEPAEDARLAAALEPLLAAATRQALATLYPMSPLGTPPPPLPGTPSAAPARPARAADNEST